jgi:hypothetical protein
MSPLPRPLAALALLPALLAADFPRVAKVERQPLAAQAKRVADALELLGAPLAAPDKAALAAAATEKDESKAVASIQDVFDRRCLVAVTLEAADKLTAVAGPAMPELAEQGWRVFLVKVVNPAGLDRLTLRADSPNAQPLTRRSTSKPDPTVVPLGEVGKRFLELTTHDAQPLVPELSGLELEYRVLGVYSRDAGRRTAELTFVTERDAGVPGPGRRRVKAGESNAVPFVFEAVPSVPVRLRVRDHDGKPVMASFTIRDAAGRVYPFPGRRLAPDFGFHPQVYRADGETVLLPPGTYSVSYTRGPEYLTLTKSITVPAKGTHEESFTLKRWVHPAKRGWVSGDHHIHAAGCSHYESPTEGVTPDDMMRHVLGEDLNVGCCLSWGPCWYHQKRYFDGKPHALSRPDYVLRYDVEVSGFPSSHCGHICLLRLREQDYPGTKLIEDWPSWDLPIFKWAKSQGGVVGFAHSGWGLDVGATKELPNLIVPPMNSIGANEYLVDVAHDMCDFLSTVDTPSVWELNIWYHTLNCGYRTRVSGETDFPCIYGDRVGLGRSYVHLPPGKPIDFDAWTEGVKKGRCYVGDGKSHLMDFAVNGVAVGTGDVRLDKPGQVTVTASMAALLEPEPTAATEAIRNRPLNEKPYWDVERARVGRTRTVPVEVIVNGKSVATQPLAADGTERELSFEVPIECSSWVALRVFPSSHTNPVWVTIGDKPVRASRRSAEWCLKGIDRCWEMKERRIREAEKVDAKAAYDHARAAYRKILAECEGN